MIGCLRTRVRKQPIMELYFESETVLKETRSVTMNIFLENFSFLFKSFVKIELSYVFTINMFSAAENCTEK